MSGDSTDGAARRAAPSRCWICGSADTSRWKNATIDRPLTAADLRITDVRYGATLALRRCRRCGFVFAGDGGLDELPQLYERLSDPGYFESAASRSMQMRWLLERIGQEHPRAHTLLDVGAGAGLLVAEARRLGLDAVGVEPSHDLVAQAHREYGVDLLQGTFPHPQLAGRRFDVIYVVDVIEHVRDPIRLLRDCAGVLGVEGILVVVTPDVGSVAARIMGRRWWHYRLAHIGYFNRTSLRRAVSEAGLVVVAEFTARWFFRIRYIAERLGQYLPIRRVTRVADRLGPLRWLYERTIPLNLHDSIGLVLRCGQERE